MTQPTRLLAAVSALAFGLASASFAAEPPKATPHGPAPTDPGMPGDSAAPDPMPGDEAQPIDPRVPGAAPLLTEAVSTPDYVSSATLGDKYEIEAAKIAVARSKNPQIVAFAQMMETDHTASSAKLGPVAMTAGVTPPTTLDTTHQAKLDELNAAADADFDKLYVDQQVMAHDAALTLHRTYAASGADIGLKAVAAELVPKIEAHAEQAKLLKDAMGTASN